MAQTTKPATSLCIPVVVGLVQVGLCLGVQLHFIGIQQVQRLLLLLHRLLHVLGQPRQVHLDVLRGTLGLAGAAAALLIGSILSGTFITTARVAAGVSAIIIILVIIGVPHRGWRRGPSCISSVIVRLCNGYVVTGCWRRGLAHHGGKHDGLACLGLECHWRRRATCIGTSTHVHISTCTCTCTRASTT